MKALVTGAAGFIGSSLSDELLRLGFKVKGIDNLTPYYDINLKHRNMSLAQQSRLFEFEQIDLAVDELHGVLSDIEWIFHLAGQAGVRSSWGNEFQDYTNWNILATQRLLEASKKQNGIKAFVAASSSSIYGNVSDSVSELDLPKPISPYGVSKMAAEHLCTLYGTQFGVPTVSLRYFTVFGPRQRPDMAINRIIHAALNESKFSVLGDGTQERDFTYVSDVVNATIKAAYFATTNSQPGECFNIAGGTISSLNRTIAIVEEILRKPIDVEYIQKSIGDPHKTFANTDKAKLLLGWQPEMAFRTGIENQISYQSM